jgi:DnaJ domain
MDITFEQACIELEIFDTKMLSKTYLKKQFHKLALKYHPDKNSDSSSLEKFQRINESYRLLIEVIGDEPLNTYVSSNDLKEEHKRYIFLLTSFIKEIVKGSYTDLIGNIIKTIVTGYEKITLTLFENLQKEHALEVYRLLKKYKNIFYLSDSVIEDVRLVILDKYKNDKIYILNPSIDDLLENNIYKLKDEEELYLVPLWHKEIYFDDKEDNDIIVICEPQLPEHIFIDETNNIVIKIVVAKEFLFDDEPNISFLIGKKVYEIPKCELYIRKQQAYTIKEKGLTKVIEDDLYNVDIRGDIIVDIQID